MHNDRIAKISEGSLDGKSVIYLMSRDQRVDDNFALYEAQQKAIEIKQPLFVIFNLRNNIKNRSREHFIFMLKGLEELQEKLNKLNINFVLTADESEITLNETIRKLEPSNIYFDFSPFKNYRARVKQLADSLNIPGYIVDNHNIIPAWIASTQQEFAARTFRYRVKDKLHKYLVEPAQLIKHPYTHQIIDSMSFADAYEYIKLYTQRDIKIAFEPGESAARELLNDFIDNKLGKYAELRNDFANDWQSNLSPYLHFGQISSLRVALEIFKKVDRDPHLFSSAIMPKPTGNSQYDGMNALFEEMIVRKELSDNFCLYNENHLSLEGGPEWAQLSMKKHESDQREYIYSLEDFENAKTHDEIWNAAQLELTKTGKMHGYMRMYWAKKILEWTANPSEALEYAIYLNDTYSIDGYDPNGYVGILWSIVGLHDRPWQERPIFGKVRYMNDQGLIRKFDVNQYIERINTLN